MPEKHHLYEGRYSHSYHHLKRQMQFFSSISSYRISFIFDVYNGFNSLTNLDAIGRVTYMYSCGYDFIQLEKLRNPSVCVRVGGGGGM